MVQTYSHLHQNIQDAFNELGVQIMSPHYLGDPAQAKIVPREQWYQPPAKQVEGEQARNGECKRVTVVLPETLLALSRNSLATDLYG